MVMNRLRLLGASAVVAAALSPQLSMAQPAVSNNGSGSAVVVPYFTVNGGWQTFVNITNTTDNALALKFRMHEAQNSRDILDFNIVLSPRDVWTGFVSKNGQGRPAIATNDRSCTSPLSVRDSGAAASEVAYTDFSGGSFRDFDGTRTSGSAAAVSRMSEGYIAILVMGEDNRTAARDVTLVDNRLDGAGNDTGLRRSTAFYAKHVNGEPRDCARVDADFQPTQNGGLPMTLAAVQADNATILGDNGSGDPIARRGVADPSADVLDAADGAATDIGFGPVLSAAPIKVTSTLVNEPRGVSTSIPVLHIENFGVSANLVTAQEFPYFLEPTLGSSNGLWTVSALGALETGIQALTVSNIWTSVPGTGAQGEWVLTLPTKRFHVDQDFNNIQAACNKFRNQIGAGAGASVGPSGEGAPFTGFDANGNGNLLDDNAPLRFAAGSDAACDVGDFAFSATKDAFQADNTGTAPIVTNNNIWDREERVASVTVTGGTRPSPAPPGDPVPLSLLDYETNVLRIGRNVASLPGVLNSVRTVLVDVTEQGLPGTNNAGWMRLNFGTTTTPFALPAAGATFIQRNQGDATLNFGNSSEHVYTRPAPL